MNKERAKGVDTTDKMMLKLTMNPRKRSKRHRFVPQRLRLPQSEHKMDLDDEEEDTDIFADTVADNIMAMVSQETTGAYNCTDYLSMTAWQQTVYELMKKPEHEFSSRHPVGNSRIDEYCREQIVEWSFRVVDYFRIDREVVAMSLSFLDRFLASCRCDRSSFKLAATTTLHLAVKLLYPCKLADLGILSDLSRGEFDMSDVSEMETHILRSLCWRLHPPTSVAFVSFLLDYFFATTKSSLSMGDYDDIYHVASFFSELAVCDYFFVPMKSSSVALASILNALEGMFGPDNALSTEIIGLARHFGLSQPQDLPAARNRLWELYERSEECALHNDKLIDDERQANWHGGIFVKKASTMSPVSVSKPCHSATDFVCPSRVPHQVRNESW